MCAQIFHAIMPEVLVKNENIKYDIISNQKQHEKKKSSLKHFRQRLRLKMHNIVFTVSRINVKALFCHASLN